MLEKGLSATSKVVVSAANTACTMGSGDLEVFATPAMVALMENAAMKAVAAALPDGSTTVGSEMNCSHIKPSKVGATITATAVLECGSLFRRRIVNGCISWGCTTHIGDRTKCDSHYYREERIYDRIVGIINRLHFGNFNILDETEHLLQMAIVARRRTSTDAMNASQSIAELNAKLLMLENLRSKGYITADVYTSQAREIKRETDRLKAQREELCESKYEKVLAEIKKLRKALERLDEPLEEFNEELFIEIVKSVEINNRDEMTVTLLGDIDITELL